MRVHTEYYAKQLAEAKEYEDYVVERMLLKHGMPINIYHHPSNQYEKGESVQWYEIKYDKVFHNTHFVYLEVEEKSTPEAEAWTNSGILRNDNTLYYLIGDKEKLFFCIKKQLRQLYEKKEYWEKRGIQEKFVTPNGFSQPTSHGITVSEKYLTDVMFCPVYALK